MASDSHTGGRILVVDDDADTRAFMARLVEQTGYPTREAGTGEEALAYAREEQPRLVVLEVCLPGVSGYQLCRELRRAFGEELPIIFVSGQRTEAYDRVAGLLVGADDYVVKPFAPDELLVRVQGLIRRSVPIAATVASRLTSRELEVLRLLAEGLGQKQIATRLFVSPKTVGTHIEHIFRKLGVRSRAQAVTMAYQKGLISVPARST
jgi:DNA-binding NarL/FixJ family response regulator